MTIPANQGAAAPAATGRRPHSRASGYLPGQHGAWAFLVVPVLVGFAVGGWSWIGLTFAACWVIAYPATYFTGRALVLRVRRGAWTRLARRELGRAVPWLAALAVLGLVLLVWAPWMAWAALALVGLWVVSLVVGARLGERSLGNDGLLVAQAACAVPLVWCLSTGTTPAQLASAPAALWEGTLAVVLVLLGSVLEVKSLLRRAGDRRFRAVNLAYQGAAALVMALINPLWLVGFGPALARAVLLRPGLRPARIGMAELVVCILFVVAAFLAL